jgi:hypothetical protein
MEFKQGKLDQRDAPVLPNEPKNRGTNIRSIDSRTIGSMVRKGPFTSNTLNTFFAGELSVETAGATLDAAPYSTYILQVFLNHNFSEVLPDYTPLYLFWIKYLTVSNTRIFNSPNPGGSPPFGVSGGTYTTSDYSVMHRGSVLPPEGAFNETEEYLLFSWTVERSAGTTTVDATEFTIIPAIIYFPNLEELTPAASQGGGGGTVFEVFNFYTYE